MFEIDDLLAEDLFGEFSIGDDVIITVTTVLLGFLLQEGVRKGELPNLYLCYQLILSRR